MKIIIVNLYQIFDTDTLRHRDTARKLVESLPKESPSSRITIDFTKIDFASRSFLHELLCDLGNRKVTFENDNEEVTGLIEIIKKKSLGINC